MRFHTPPQTVDVVQVVPGIEAYARTVTRLHPRRGPVTARMSHIGGLLLWPADEPWPTCTTPCEVRRTVPMPAAALERMRSLESAEALPTAATIMEQMQAMAMGLKPDPARWVAATEEVAAIIRAEWPDSGMEMHRAQGTVTLTQTGSHEVPNPLLPVCQLRAADVPDLWCPPGFDVLQVLWCPCEHHYNGPYGPMIELRWRREADELGEATPPVGEVGNDGYRPILCGINPEQVVEYPPTDDLPTDLADAVRAWSETTDENHVRDFSSALLVYPGWKVGGWPKSYPIPKELRGCPRCGQPMPLLLTIASNEFDGGNRLRWQVIEDQAIDSSNRQYPAVREPTGIKVGRWGSLCIFVCTQCPDPPYRWDIL